jgi:hypothetical protein
VPGFPVRPTAPGLHLLYTPPRPHDKTTPWRVAITPPAQAVTPRCCRRRPSRADPAPPAYHPPWRRPSTSKHGAPGHDKTQRLPPDDRGLPIWPLPERSRRPKIGIPAGHHGPARAPASTKISPPNRLTPAISSPAPLPASSRTTTTTSLPFLSTGAPPPPSTATTSLPPPEKPPPRAAPTQGEGGNRSSSSPSPFSPTSRPLSWPGSPSIAAGRPPQNCLPSLICSGPRKGKEKAVLLETP